MSSPYLVTVILNTNRRDDTLECINSLNASTYDNHSIIVLDNQSTDGSVDVIKNTYPEIQIIELHENLGYGGNNNVGIKAAIERKADWIFVLNEDVIVSPNCLEQIVESGERDPDIGIIGPIVYHHQSPHLIQSAGGTLGQHWEVAHAAVDEPDHGQFNNTREVDWISGCGIVVRRQAIEEVGLIDDRFFYYWDETEWCMRMHDNGWKVILVPSAKIWHKGVTVNHQPKPTVTYYATRNRLHTLAKHHAPISVWAFAWAQLLRTLTSWTIKPRWRYMRDHRNAMWYGIVDFLHGRWGQMPNRS